MFKKLKVENNNYTIYENSKYNEQEYIDYIESLLLENKDIFTILKNENESYSIYKNKDIEDDFIVDPIITFSKDENLRKVSNTLRQLIDYQRLIDKTINSYENKIKENNRSSKLSYKNLLSKLNKLEQLIYSNKKELELP